MASKKMSASTLVDSEIFRDMFGTAEMVPPLADARDYIGGALVIY